MKNIDVNRLRYRLIQGKDYPSFKNFNCGNSSMDNFLIHHNAYYYTITKEASTSLIIYNNGVVGYFTLQRKKVREFKDIEENTFLFVQRLAVDIRYQHQGIGTAAIQHIFSLASLVNERLIFLDALIEKIDWYEDLKFIPVIPEEEARSNKDGLVLLVVDLYDEHLVSAYLGLNEEDLIE